ncbi:MAG: apolipoprotein N-acyltransferase [Firmicutes bacterium]|nr:apolipoprotein N-acyltransferase [Bacillota bacterium]
MSYLVVFISGIITALPLIVSEAAPVVWFSLIPLFVSAMTKKSAYRHGLVFGLGYYGVMYHWFVYLYPFDFAGFNKVQAVFLIALCWGGLALLQSVGTAFVPFLLKKLKTKNSFVNVFCSASLWALFEWLQTQTWLGVPWGRLAVTQYKVLPVIQSASLLGSLFTGFIIALVNACCADAYIRLKETGKLEKTAFAAAAVVLLNFGYGVVALNLRSETRETVDVALIQGNIASGDKWADDSVERSLDLYSSLTEEACEENGAKLVVWPETVITTSARQNQIISAAISDLAEETGAVIFVGTFDKIFNDKTDKYDTYNAIAAFYPDGTVGENPYYKRHLVPFGEYLPMPGLFKTLVPALADMNLFDSDLTPGEDAAIMETEYGDVGALVCFDSIYEELTLSSVREGAQIIVLSTNDSWYRDSAAVYQHNGHAVLRAVESGRYVLRAANTGISSIIAPDGRIISSLGPLKEGFVTGKAAFSDERTVYSYVGNLIVWLSAAYVAVCAVFKVRSSFLKIHNRQVSK